MSNFEWFDIKPLDKWKEGEEKKLEMPDSNSKTIIRHFISLET